MALGSAMLLGLYDVAKKQALKENGVLQVLFVATAFSTLLMCPHLFLERGSAMDHLSLFMKGILVSTSWISGMIALKTIPITITSTLKASRPFLVVIFSIILFGERLNAWQWGGVCLALLAVTLLSHSSKSEGINFARNKGIWAMAVSILSGVASALFDKYIITSAGMQPLFVQSWANFYITLILGLCLLWRRFYRKENLKPLRWDWTLAAIAVLITAADALYFFAIQQEGALLSVISLARRASVIVTFAVGAIFFKEGNLRRKAADLAILLAGMVLLMIGSV